nr:zinc transporter ZIP3-like isoform X2 [Procambarus clarkii]
MELLTTKIIALTLMGALSLVFGLLPLRLRKCLAQGSRRRERTVSCLLCFGGGVLLATVFTHMLPETRESFSKAFQKKLLSAGAHYPLAELVTCAGFFLIYFVEEFVHKLQESARCSVYSVTASGTSVESKGKPGVLSPKSRWAETGVDNPVFAGDFDAAAWNPALKEAIISGTQVTPSELQGTGRGPVVAPEAPQGGHHHHGGHQHAGHGHSHLGISKLGSKGIAFNLRSLLVILALSFHSVFEGLAVGLQENDTDVWYLLLAICAHKFVIAFCVGLELLAGGTSAGLMVVYMVVFALVSPLGIAIGIVVTENLSSEEEGHLVAVTILQGLAGGTILYVTFFEVLERERGRGGGRILKFLFVLMGFGAMASLEAIGGHSHGPSEGDCHGHSHGDILATTTSSTTDDHDHDHHDHDHHDHDHHDHEHTH